MTTLADVLRARIAREGPITVRDFMHACLYDPELGYYARGRPIGASGDFYTSANASLFAGCVARFVRAARERVGDDARVVELGGGTGQLAAALDLPVTVVEPHEGMARQQRARGLDVVASLDALDPAPSVVVANEVLDALPVHRLRRTRGGELREGHVDWREGRFVEVPGPLSRPELEEAGRRYAPWLDQDGAVEVNLDAEALLASLPRAAPRCVALFVDYGGLPDELWGATRPHGSLRGYHEHKTADWWARPGEQDLTADVDFALVQEQARDAGFEVVGYRTQGEWLADAGLVEAMQAALAGGDTQAYLAAKNLLFPGGMGERFKALGLARGVDATGLVGFRPGFPGGFPR